MNQRPIWRGHLRLALVSCPVALYSARHDRGSIRFHLINPATGNRVRMVTQDSGTDQELERRDLVKGFEYEKGRYVILTEDDLASVKVESSSVITVEKFVDAASIDPVYYDASYFLAPDGGSGADVYAVLREAIAETNQVALSRVVMSQRERTVALRPMGAGLILHTLHEERDLNSPASLFEGASALSTDPQMVELATQLIRRQSGRYDPADLEDRYETRLRAMLDAKLQGQDPEAAVTVPAEASNVVDIMAALKRSLGQVASAPAPRKNPAGKTRSPATAPKAAKAEAARRQPGLKLPIEGGLKGSARSDGQKAATAPTTGADNAGRRRRAS